MRTGSCKYGYACKFHHPQPALAANVLPVLGPVYGSGASAVVPSTGAPSASVSAASVSKATYFASSYQVPQSYMPLFLPPSQGWNTYMVCSFVEIVFGSLFLVILLLPPSSYILCLVV